MSKITTEECKNFLISYFKNKNIDTNEKEWKRESKYKKNNFWIRSFVHLNIGTISLIEQNDTLGIYNDEVKEPEITYFKQFNEEEVKGAKNLIKKLIKIRINHSDDQYEKEEELFETKEWKLYSHALSSQFTFYFPFDPPDEIYNNHPKYVTDGLDTALIPIRFQSFCITFNDKNTNDIDLYTSDVLSRNVLPAWTDFIDEYHVEATDQSPKNLTIKNFINILFDLGFEYDNKGYDCLLEKEIKNYISNFNDNKKINNHLEKKC